MVITEIKRDNKKYKIYIDGEYTFTLYYTEIKKYNLREQEEISLELIEYIGKEIIIKRGMSYLNHLLAKRDYTRQELSQKLIKSGYKETYIECMLDKLEGQKLVDDLSYTKRFIEQMVDKKSKRWIVYYLQQKGIKKEILDEVLNEYQIDEYEAAKNQLLKKVKDKTELSFEEQGKLYLFLLRKGFSSSTICKVIDNELNSI